MDNTNFKFACPHCGQHLEAESDWVGMEVECPRCGKAITVPKPPSAKAAEPASSDNSVKPHSPPVIKTIAKGKEDASPSAPPIITVVSKSKATSKTQPRKADNSNGWKNTQPRVNSFPKWAYAGAAVIVVCIVAIIFLRVLHDKRTRADEASQGINKDENYNQSNESVLPRPSRDTPARRLNSLETSYSEALEALRPETGKRDVVKAYKGFVEVEKRGYKPAELAVAHMCWAMTDEEKEKLKTFGIDVPGGWAFVVDLMHAANVLELRLAKCELGLLEMSRGNRSKGLKLVQEAAAEGSRTAKVFLAYLEQQSAKSGMSKDLIAQIMTGNKETLANFQELCETELKIEFLLSLTQPPKYVDNGQVENRAIAFASEGKRLKPTPLGRENLKGFDPYKGKSKEDIEKMRQDLLLDNKTLLDKVIDGKITPPDIYGHFFDAKTGHLYRSDGGIPHMKAEIWNARMDYSTSHRKPMNPPTLYDDLMLGIAEAPIITEHHFDAQTGFINARDEKELHALAAIWNLRMEYSLSRRKPSNPPTLLELVAFGEVMPPIPSYHHFDSKTGHIYRNDGKAIDIEAEVWNGRMDYSTSRRRTSNPPTMYDDLMMGVIQAPPVDGYHHLNPKTGLIYRLDDRWGLSLVAAIWNLRMEYSLSGRTPSDPPTIYDQIVQEKESPPNISQHYCDYKTGFLYRIDQQPLHSLASIWNMRMFKSVNGNPPTSMPKLYQQLIDGTARTPLLDNHFFDFKTGLLYRTDGAELAEEAKEWNRQMSGLTPVKSADHSQNNSQIAPIRHDTSGTLASIGAEVHDDKYGQYVNTTSGTEKMPTEEHIANNIPETKPQQSESTSVETSIDVPADMQQSQLERQLKELSRTPVDYEVAGKWFKIADEIENDGRRQQALMAAGAALIYSKKGDVYQNHLRQMLDNAVAFENEFMVACSDCKGSNQSKRSCASCKGTGRCHYANCQGGRHRVHQINGDTYEKCRECKGSGRCQKCNGKGYLFEKCPRCGGKGKTMDRDLLLAAYKKHAGIAANQKNFERK